VKRTRGLYRYSGYLAFKVMAELHQKLWPNQSDIDVASRRATHIFSALSKAYTDGIEDAAQLDDRELAKIRRRISEKDADI
jgi:hypothetical protein